MDANRHLHCLFLWKCTNNRNWQQSEIYDFYYYRDLYFASQTSPFCWGSWHNDLGTGHDGRLEICFKIISQNREAEWRESFFKISNVWKTYKLKNFDKNSIISWKIKFPPSFEADEYNVQECEIHSKNSILVWEWRIAPDTQHSCLILNINIVIL